MRFSTAAAQLNGWGPPRLLPQTPDLVHEKTRDHALWFACSLCSGRCRSRPRPAPRRGRGTESLPRHVASPIPLASRVSKVLFLCFGQNWGGAKAGRGAVNGGRAMGKPAGTGRKGGLRGPQLCFRRPCGILSAACPRQEISNKASVGQRRASFVLNSIL